ncbi:hypothetical protein EDB19DRAFT_1771591 [Suillus lakei]|nr:hypothetical protein EDB19DRAFT_1771591 [Suillus lakei]
MTKLVLLTLFLSKLLFSPSGRRALAFQSITPESAHIPQVECPAYKNTATYQSRYDRVRSAAALMHASSLEGAAFALISIPLFMAFSHCLTAILRHPDRPPTLPTQFSVVTSRTSRTDINHAISLCHSALDLRLPEHYPISNSARLSNIVTRMKRALLICAKLSSFLATRTMLYRGELSSSNGIQH